MCAICDLKIDFNIDHPHALTVAVATREAIDAGQLPATVFDGPFANANLRLAAIDALKALQQRLEASMPASELMALPDFYVLLIEVGTWGYFHANEQGFDPDCSPEPPDVTAANVEDRDVVFISTETALQAILDHRIGLDSAFERNLLMLDAGAGDAARLRRVLEMSVQFGAAVPEES